MSRPVSDEEWQRLRNAYGDLAYEHPEMHEVLLKVLEKEKPAE